jgi:signal transduction histidine kinase
LVCRSFDRSDGLPTLECSTGHQPACWKARDGRLWFATVKGAVVVNPSEVPVNTLPPHTLVEEMRVDAKPWASPLSAEPRVPAGKHYVEFQFTAPSLVAPEKVRFRWRLKGMQSDWVGPSSQRTVNYNFLPPGRYTFQVQACNDDNVWDEVGAEVAFAVLPHVWQTLWFRTVAPATGILLMGGTGFWLLRRRHRLQLERVQHAKALEEERARVAETLLAHQQEMERERTRIARDLHDDLGASLTHLSWLSEAAARGKATAPENRTLLEQVAERSRAMVRKINEIVWALNPKNDSLEHLATYLCHSAEQFFHNHPTRCRLDVQEPLPSCPLASDVRHNIFLITREALHNVAKHASASEVWLRIRVENHEALLTIEDDGRGFTASEPQRGNGLENMRRRAESMAARFELRSAPGSGTMIQIRLPLQGFGKSPLGGDRQPSDPDLSSL